MTQALDEIKIGGLGASRKRVEDNRFIRGKGNYTDDIVLPGMLHMEILRSPLAHARIKSIDTSRAWQIPGVHLVLTGEMMATRNLAWMPTLSYDTQAVLATDKVRFQGQEVACVIADDPYIAKDACEVIDVEYEPLPAIVNPEQAVAEGAPVIRDDKENQGDNVIYHWEVGDAGGTERAFAQADKVSKLKLHYPRSHPSPIECCGSIADFNRATSKLTVYMTTQAPHIIRAAVALVAELPEHMIRIISPDIGGGFGNKVPVYPGYVCSILASILLERPVKWIEDKSGNLISTGFARDIYLDGEVAMREDGKILAVRMHCDADHGAFFSDAQPSKFKIGLLHSAFASYDIPVGHITARGTYSNKAPGGVAYRCSFRVTEAMFFQERMIQAAAHDLGMDQAEFRRVNFVRDDQFPHRTPFGFLTDSGQYAKCLDVGLRAVGYQDFLRQKQEAKAKGRLLGIGISTMTEPLGAGNSREYDILGIKMFDSAELKVHMTGKAIVRTGARTQGQGHETTWAQIVSHELGIPAEDVVVEEGDTDTAPFGMGTYASRSTPVAGAAVAMVSRKIRAKARKLAAHLLEVSEEDVEWELGRFYVRSAPTRGVTIQECAMAAYSNMPDGMEPGLENTALLRPAEPHLAIRRLHRHGRGRPGDRRLGRAEHGRGRRLWRAHQPHDRRRADHGRADRGLCDGEHAVHHVRRRGQLRRLELYGLPAAHRLGDAGVRAAQRGRHPVPAPPDRGQGHRRVRRGRRPGGLRQRGDGRDLRHRSPQRRHAAAAGPGLGGADLSPRRVRRTAGALGRLRKAPWTVGVSWSRPASWPGAGSRSRWPRWSGGRAPRPASRARARSSRPTASCTAGSAGPARSRSSSARRSR